MKPAVSASSLPAVTAASCSVGPDPSLVMAPSPGQLQIWGRGLMLAFLVNCIMFSISFANVDGGVLEESRAGGVHSFVDLFSMMFLLVWNGICISPGKAAYWISLIWSRVRINKDCRDELALFCIYDYYWVLVCILPRERPIDAFLEYLIVGAIGILYFSICRCLRGGVAVLDYLLVLILRELDEMQAGCRTWVQGRCRQTFGSPSDSLCLYFCGLHVPSPLIGLCMEKILTISPLGMR